MITKLKLWYWTRRLRAEYQAMQRIGDNYDCGHSLLLCMSSSYYRAVEQVNVAIRRIKELDPSAKLKEFDLQ